jgi:hypothetical protein
VAVHRDAACSTPGTSPCSAGRSGRRGSNRTASGTRSERAPGQLQVQMGLATSVRPALSVLPELSSLSRACISVLYVARTASASGAPAAQPGTKTRPGPRPVEGPHTYCHWQCACTAATSQFASGSAPVEISRTVPQPLTEVQTDDSFFLGKAASIVTLLVSREDPLWPGAE